MLEGPGTMFKGCFIPRKTEIHGTLLYLKGPTTDKLVIQSWVPGRCFLEQNKVMTSVKTIHSVSQLPNTESIF